MNIDRTGFAGRLLGAVLLTTIVALIAASPGSAGKKPKLFYLDYNGQAMEHPEDIFLTANSGPRVLDIGWRKWGKKQATGRGTYYSNCNCPAEEQGRGIITLSKPVVCTPDFGSKEGKKIRVYKRGSLEIKIDGDVRSGKIPTGYDVCR